MKYSSLSTGLCLVIAAICSLMFSCSDNPVSSKPDNSLSGQLGVLTGKYKIPGAIGIIFNDTGAVEMRASGVRRAGYPGNITTSDLMHIGSLTKWMTATMIGTLVDEGLLSWSTKPADVIPELAGTMDTGYAHITLLDLLRHRAGIPADEDFDSIPTLTGTLRQQREQASRIVLAMPPAVAPGTYRYANVGYVIAACMAEAVTNQDWRTLMDTRLFQPLGITACYGWPTEHDASEPWGHILNGRAFQSVAPSIEPTTMKFLEPAGFVSMTLDDYAKFIRLQMQAAQGRPHLLSASAFDTLQTPVVDYACGVGVIVGSRGTLFWHNGSNTFFYMLMYMMPEKNIAIAIAVNAGDQSVMAPVSAATDNVFTPLIK